MEIGKESNREAFEAIPRNARVLRGAKFKDGEYVALSLFDESSKELAAQLNYGWEVWQAAKAHEAEKLKGCVLVPVQCPDPDFADSLFDELSKKAIGEFGDDLLIHFSDIDEEKIWALMVEAAKAQAAPEGFVLVDKHQLAQLMANMDSFGKKALAEALKVDERRITHWLQCTRPVPEGIWNDLKLIADQRKSEVENAIDLLTLSVEKLSKKESKKALK